MDFFQNLHPVIQALLATGFTWAMTALGAAVVFTARDFSRRVLDAMLGFAAGVMIAASYWSLLAPAIAMSEGKDIPAWVPAVVGFLLGGIFLRGVDKGTCLTCTLVFPPGRLRGSRQAGTGAPCSFWP